MVLNLTKKNLDQHLYFYLLASNRTINEELKFISALGEHYSDKQLQDKEAKYVKRLDELQSENNNLENKFINTKKDLEKIINSRSYDVYSRIIQTYRSTFNLFRFFKIKITKTKKNTKKTIHKE